MQVKEIKLYHFRNYQELEFYPHSGVNLFCGRNGSGKTNLLEAIHYCSLGRSHRVSNDSNVIKNDENNAFSCVLVQNSIGQRKISIQFRSEMAQKKTIFIDEKKIQRFSDMMGCLRCVIFSPEDLGLVKEGPSFRRRYLDMMISQMNKKYFVALQRYKAGMDQRNAVIREARSNSVCNNYVLDVFEQAMSESAEVIINERRRVISQLSDIAERIYQRISDTDEKFRITYHSSIKDNEKISENLTRLLRENREDDMRTGYTSVGPHRDDLSLLLNNNQMKQYASQGQIRSAALSMKLSQMEIITDFCEDTPILLLDDVMSELDRKRRSRLLNEISSFQTYITCTDRDDIDSEKINKAWRVATENGKAFITEVN